MGVGFGVMVVIRDGNRTRILEIGILFDTDGIGFGVTEGKDGGVDGKWSSEGG